MIITVLRHRANSSTSEVVKLLVVQLLPATLGYTALILNVHVIGCSSCRLLYRLIKYQAISLCSARTRDSVAVYLFH
jgi:hypothetical protein